MNAIINHVEGYTVKATDGEVGKVDTLYFDDLTWAIRYLVVNVGNWLIADKILLSPAAVTSVSREDETIYVGLTKEQVKNSPDVNSQKPVSRQHEVALHRYYGWDPYWLTAPTYSDGLTALNTVALRQNVAEAEMETAVADSTDDAETATEATANLRSTKEVEGYYIQAADDEIGHIEKFLVDTEFWFIRYFVIDTRNWLPGKKVVVSPEWVNDINWADREVNVNLTRDSIENSPEYEKPATVDRDYEQRLYDHYDQAIYWHKADVSR